MPHKEGHWGYKTRKKLQKTTSNIKKGFQMGAAGYKALSTGKNPVKAALKIEKKIDTENRFKKSNKEKTDKGKPPTKAQLIAQKRIASGKTIAQVKAENKAKMKANAKKRNEQFKKTGKSTVEERRAAAKKAMQDRARKRNEAFKKKRAKK
tara:strand:- start:106 stop:558 length:453 start_codon:yes stop_codon:yes gene_type:complete